MSGFTEGLNENFNQPTSETFSFDAIHQTFGDQAEQLDQALKLEIATMDPNSTKDMVNFQVQFNKFMIVEGLRSSIIKTIKDTLQSIIQKI